MPALLADNTEAVDREVRELSEWWRSGQLYYHTRKMARADAFKLSNVGALVDTVPIAR